MFIIIWWLEDARIHAKNMDWVGPTTEGTSSVSHLGLHTLSRDSSWALRLFRPHGLTTEAPQEWLCHAFKYLRTRCFPLLVASSAIDWQMLYIQCVLCVLQLCASEYEKMFGYISKHTMFFCMRCQLDMLFRKANVLSNLQSLSSAPIFTTITESTPDLNFPSAVCWRQRMHLPQCRPCRSWLLQAQQDK